MSEQTVADFYRQRDVLRQQWHSPLLQIREAEGKGIALDERLLQYVWAHGMLRGTMKTLSGKPVVVISPGRWNTEGGPDFLAAEFTIGGTHSKGDVEIHINSSDWRGHRHHQERDYNNTQLHCFLTLTDKKEYDVRADGERIERLELAEYIFPELATIKSSLSPEELPFKRFVPPGRCAEFFAREDERALRQFFLSAGRARLESKIERFHTQLCGTEYEQTLYQALMTAMGYKGTRSLFFLLAKRVPLAELKDFAQEHPPEQLPYLFQAILLNVASLLPESTTGYDEETISYLDRLYHYWQRYSQYYLDRIIPASRLWHRGVRPANFPERRIAAVAHLLSRYLPRGNLLDELREQFAQSYQSTSTAAGRKKWLRKLTQMLVVREPEDYWARRFQLGETASKRVMSLIGEARARSLAFNAVLPLLILNAREKKGPEQEQRLWQLIEEFPALEENVVTRFMKRRIFQETPHALFVHELCQQGLFQVFHECCNNQEVSCQQCYFFSAPD